MRLFAVLSVFLVALGGSPRDASTGARADISLPTSRAWEMFREACVDTFPSYARIEHALDRMGFEPAWHFQSVRRGFERWRGETANIIFGGLNGSGPVNCMMTVWQESSPRNKSDRQCIARKGSPEQTKETSEVDGWETPGWLVVVLDQSLGSGCESYILIATSKAP